MLDLGFLMLLVAWSLVVGLGVLRLFGPIPDHRGDAMALAVPVGLGTLAMAVLALGELGWLNRSGLLFVFLLGGVAVGLPREGRSVLRDVLVRPPTLLRTRPRLDPMDVVFNAAFFVTALGTLLTALAPVTDGDALCYHLQVPKLFLWRKAVGYEPDLHETVYPLVTELLDAVALAFRGPVACRLVQWVLGLAFAGNVASLARPMLGDRARWAGTIAMLVPAVSNGMGAPLNDVSLAAFCMASMVAWTRWLDRPTLGRAALAGALAGLSLGVKYPALVWTAVLGAGMVASALLRPSGSGVSTRIRAAIGHAALFGAVAVVMGVPWYLRAYVHTGNPVHPFFRHTFGGSGFDVVLAPDKRPMDPTLWNLLTALGPMTLDPDRFDSFSHQFGPAFLLFLPAILLWRPPVRLGVLLGLGYAFLMICLTQRQSMRFVLPAVGPMAVGVAWLVARWRTRPGLPTRLLISAVAVMLAFEASIALARSRHGLEVVLGRETPEAFLHRREPTYRVGRWIEAHLPDSARLIGQDHRGFYIPRFYAMEKAHRRRTGLGSRGESPERIVSHFLEQGFTHLMMCPPSPENAVEFDPTLGRLLAPWLARQRPIYREAITDADGVTRHYAIYDLQRPAAMASTGFKEARR